VHKDLGAGRVWGNDEQGHEGRTGAREGQTRGITMVHM
jgi:hypothetical protein